MRAFCLAAFLFCTSAVSFGQTDPSCPGSVSGCRELAPNPGCPGSAPYCRGQVTVTGVSTAVTAVIGSSGGILYGWQGSGNNPPQPTCLTDPGILSFYSSSTFNPETWFHLADVPTTLCADYPIELVFGSNACSAWKYIYTHGHRILRASNTDWNFFDISPNLPQGALSLPASFTAVNQGSQTRLFYGNYGGGAGGGQIWHSDDCGNTWSAPDPFGGFEIHAINADPKNSSIIYVNVDTEGLPQPNTAIGLWRSTSNGDTGSFTRVSSNLPNNEQVVGINFVFPLDSSKLFMETDNQGAVATGGPLLSWDKINGGDTQIAASWPPTPPNVEAWTGSGHAIKLTSEQNIFMTTINEANNTRHGVWYFEPPDYDTPILLEDVAPRIASVAIDGTQTVTVVTMDPHGIVSADPTHGQAGDLVTINGLPGFTPVDGNDNPTPVTVTVTAPNSFTYACSTCTPNQTSTGTGFVIKTSFENFTRTVTHTVEVTDPNTDITYLYFGNQRIVKPMTMKTVTTIMGIVGDVILN